MRILLACIVLAIPTAALAQQALIPSPYPSGVTGAEPLDPALGGLGGPQTIIRDPYPQETGEYAQGNPPISRHRRYQRLVPDIYQRKYLVERHGGGIRWEGAR